MSLNRYLTKLQDLHFKTKSQITKAKNFSKKFHARRALKIKEDIINELTGSGMSEFQALFELEEK